MINHFTFNGKSSADFGMYISGSGVYNAPERDVEIVSVPGRNGTLTIDNGRFHNISVKYPVFVIGDFQKKSQKIKNWLLSTVGYQTLTDTYDSSHFRKARFLGPIDWVIDGLAKNGKADLVFDCMPQKYRYPIETITINANSSYSFFNKTLFDIYPKFTVYGSGSGSFAWGFRRSNDSIFEKMIIELSDIQEYCVIDCEQQSIYRGSENYSNHVILDDFPVFYGGELNAAEIGSINGNITKIEVELRRWEL